MGGDDPILRKPRVPRVLVTGALGNVGRPVVLEALRRGLSVRAAVRDERNVRGLPECEVIRFDFLDRATWPAALTACDYVFLLRPPPLSDMDATLNPFVAAAYAQGVQHIVFLSVAGADRMKWIPHRKVELHLQAAGNRFTLLRAGFFSQNLGDAYRRDVVEDDRLFVPAGQGRVAFLDAADIGEAAAEVLENSSSFLGQTLTLTGPEAITFAQAAALLTARLGRTIHYEPASLLGYVRHLRRRRGLPWMQIAVQAFLHHGLSRGDAEQVDPALQALLGRPARSVEQYIERSAGIWARPSSEVIP